MTKAEALRIARKQAAGLIDSMDLEQLYGDDEEKDEAVLTTAQHELARIIRSNVE